MFKKIPLGFLLRIIDINTTLVATVVATVVLIFLVGIIPLNDLVDS